MEAYGVAWSGGWRSGPEADVLTPGGYYAGPPAAALVGTDIQTV